MALVSRTTGSGLVLREHSMDEAALGRALRNFDERLVLWPPDAMSPYYRVYCRVSDWQEATCICTWMDEQGNPMPLSSGLVERVQRLSFGARNKGPDADERNDLRELQIEKRRTDAREAITEDHRARVEKGRLTIGMSTSNRRRKPIR